MAGMGTNCSGVFGDFADTPNSAGRRAAPEPRLRGQNSLLSSIGVFQAWSGSLVIETRRFLPGSLSLADQVLAGQGPSRVSALFGVRIKGPWRAMLLAGDDQIQIA